VSDSNGGILAGGDDDPVQRPPHLPARTPPSDRRLVVVFGISPDLGVGRKVHELIRGHHLERVPRGGLEGPRQRVEADELTAGPRLPEREGMVA